MAMEETPKHFSRVIRASTLQDKKLRIPKEFLRKFRDELSAFATITTPDSRVWQVGLSKDGRNIWFHHGLQDFIEYYSICRGYFLLFEYKKMSKFHVIIFDRSTVEISYEPKKEENLIHHDEIEKDEGYRIYWNKKGSADLDSSRPRHEREMQSRNCKMKEPVQVKTDTADNGEDEHLQAFPFPNVLSFNITSEDEETTMGSEDSGSVFVRGSLVEVTSNLDGYRGAWFVAKVLETPPPNLRRSSRTMAFLVEYQTLLSKDGKKLLREHVNLGLIRPLPPPREEEMHRFQVNDVVDGYYNDGWWVGVVCHVMCDCEAEDSKPYTVLFDDPPDSIKFRPSELRFHLDWVDGKWVQPQKRIMQQMEVGTSSRKRKRGERPKFLLRERVDSSSKAEDIEMAIVPINADEPISICQPVAIGVDSSICDRTVNQSSEGEGRQCDTRKAAIDNVPGENRSLRLLESSSSIRSSIQSMEVFRLMPQKPHFRPLNECNEIIWEGLAIAQWLIFAKVVEQISELQVDASRSLFDSIVECLSELESHGFDVKAVRSRLLELQTMKESQEQLQTKLENFKCEIVERTHKETKIKAEMDDAAKELKVLEEKIDAVEKKKTRLVSMIKENDSTTAKLKSSDDLVNEEIWKVVQNFESLAGSPW